MMIDAIANLGAQTPALGGVGRVDSAARAGQATLPAGEFEKLLGEAIVDVADKLRGAEAISIAGVKGLASTQDVVEKVMAAEQTLQAAIAVRDKVVAAYMEISRMSI